MSDYRARAAMRFQAAQATVTANPKTSGTVIAVVIVCILALVLGLVFGLRKKKPTVTEPSVPAAPAAATVVTPDAAAATAAATTVVKPVAAAVDPRVTLLSSAQTIQGSTELPLKSTMTKFNVTSLDITKQVAYTMSMDIFVSATAPTWRNVMSSSGDFGVSGSTRRPAVFITGAAEGVPERVHIVHGSKEDNNKSIVSNERLTLGQYNNITWSVGGGKMTVYINGILDDSSPTATYTWASKDDWAWADVPSDGSIRVKNVYMFNKVLTPAEVQLVTGVNPTSAKSGYFNHAYFGPKGDAGGLFDGKFQSEELCRAKAATITEAKGYVYRDNKWRDASYAETCSYLKLGGTSLVPKNTGIDHHMTGCVNKTKSLDNECS